MANKIKVTPEGWLAAARDALIADGIAGVKVDRLAKTLGVTRGGFYHYFKDQQDLLTRLLESWEQSNDFLPDTDDVSSPAEALRAIEELSNRLISERDFSPSFDLAVREWARIDSKIRRTVDRVDEKRIASLTTLFSTLGCDDEEAPIRARVFYFHQIGFYALGYHTRQSKAERQKNAPVYLRILCGRRYIEAAASEARKWA